ncbi:peptidoglycan D,D-transpeptidase FtsI family protein [Brevibacillus dissolubilis]|uniref:peptidoglycan D,D-transpeptidase FtsI family protein n=1 Tax=Brevibacillus dissolubilis TaxID=1844116 RepID=UPI001116F5F9|nr:penicillin-binding protein 2 [Brevibacillus dissolubilis]
MKLMMTAKRRSFVILLVMTLVWMGLLGRLWWIQLGSPHRFSPHQVNLVKAAVKQRQQTIILNIGRGDILDRNGASFTGQEQKGLIIFPLARGSLEGTEALAKVADIINQPKERIQQVVMTGKSPAALRDEHNNIIELTDRQAEDINKLKIPGIMALAVTDRYRQDAVAKHVIGYLSQNPDLVKSEYQFEYETGKMTEDSLLGASGVERTFDRFLQGVEPPSSLSYYVDGRGVPLRGLDVRYTYNQNSFYPLSIVTTLNRELQRDMEQVADDYGMREGSIVILDIQSGDVLSMVSRPSYDPSHVNVNKDNWQNHAVKQLPPGSIFKTVVAAAALAEGVVSPTDEFLCEGEYGKYGFSCWKKEGHGHLTMQEAFAQSCNISFAEIAKRVGGPKVEEYAKKLGITAPAGWSAPYLYKIQNFRQIDGEEKGNVFSPEVSHHDEGVLIQTAIGQRDVRMTPLQAANMMATIARGGKQGQVRLVSDITYKNGINFHHFSPKIDEKSSIDPVTTRKLTRMLQEVVNSGTGTALRDLPMPVAGKSGTAEVTIKGEARTHHWFAGFAPANEPRFAIAVVVENLPTYGTHQATQVFGKAVRALSDRLEQSASPQVATSHR